MKRYSRSLIAVMLSIFTLIAVLSGCSYNNGEPINYGNGAYVDFETAADMVVSTDSDTGDTAETEKIVEVDVSIFANGKTDFNIVISNLASEIISSAANDIKSAFASKLGVSIDLYNEYYFKALHDGSLKGSKIVVGTLTEDNLSAEIEKPLRDGEYVLKVTDGSLYIIGGTEAATVQAVNYFINVFVKNANTPIEFKSGVIYAKNTSAPVINMAIASNEIWRYSIVHDNTVFAKACAERVRAIIASVAGYTLPMTTDDAAETTFEILVGKTNRLASTDVRSKYSRPNVYYDIKTVGKKLVVMGEGYLTLDKVANEFEGYVSSMGGFGSSIEGIVKSGNVIALVDAGAGESMFSRANDTELRVMHWNMSYKSASAPNIVYTDSKTRGEIMADSILQIYPDIVTVNELCESDDKDFYGAVIGELGEYYHVLASEYEKDKPAEGADAIVGKGINSNILYKKAASMTVISSGWRYSSEKIDATAENPGGWVYNHGYHTVVFKTHYGDRFIISVAQNADSRTSDTWTKEHLAAVEDAKATLENADNIPIILTGDMYTYVNKDAEANGAGYRYIQSNGYLDAQVSALINANLADGCIGLDNTKHGTVHDVGVNNAQGASEDLIWINNGFSALKFKVLTTKEMQTAGNHYPVVVDLKLS